MTFYSHQLHGPKSPLRQIWIAGTMDEKINRKKLNKLDIVDICEKIQNPPIPMAPRISGILMCGVLNVFESKVNTLYDDVSRLLVEIDEALEEGKYQAKRVAITLPDKEHMPFEMEQYHQSNATTTMRLDDVEEEPNFGNGGSDEEEKSRE
ncbi:hypothetical protein P8452_44312 [Trifolium repens]|nr:hypothetical protein P8452_44312 [Trifolium repens]